LPGEGREASRSLLLVWGKITSSVAVLGNGVTNAAKFDAESVCRENVVRSHQISDNVGASRHKNVPKNDNYLFFM